MCSIWLARVLNAISFLFVGGRAGVQRGQRGLNHATGHHWRLVKHLHGERQQNLRIERVSPVRRDQIMQIDGERRIAQLPSAGIHRGQIQVT